MALLLAGFDRDGDARVTRAESNDGAVALARDWADGIGYIAFADWSERYLGDRNVNPSALEVDRDGNGRITPAEFADRIDAVFVRLDTDNSSRRRNGANHSPAKSRAIDEGTDRLLVTSCAAGKTLIAEVH